MDWLLQPWPWYVAGPLIGSVMALLLFMGKSFGVSSNLRTLCAIGGAGRFSGFFRFEWRNQLWNLLFVAGALLGGMLLAVLEVTKRPVELSAETVEHLTALGVGAEDGLLPQALFGMQALMGIKGWIILVVGGFLVGFGTRWAGGCTSGHAISGLSNLQKPSLIAVVGFFAGGLLMTHLLLPWILAL